MEQSLIYLETRFSGRRRFELHPDKICIQGKTFLISDFDISVKLKDLDPNYQRLRVREKAFVSGIWLIIVPLITAEILHSAFKVSFENPVMGLMFCFSVCGAVTCVATFRKVEFYQFKNSSGIAVLDIARSGKDKKHFDKFVEQLVSCIKHLENPGAPTE
jgi:hypothetical protein